MRDINVEATINGDTVIHGFVYIEGGVKIGARCIIKPFAFICEGVTIEDDVFIGPHVTFTNDKYPILGSEWELLPTTVKRGASIGAGAVICPGVTIGEYAMVGAGSVVTKSVPAHTWVRGNPARPKDIDLNKYLPSLQVSKNEAS